MRRAALAALVSILLAPALAAASQYKITPVPVPDGNDPSPRLLLDGAWRFHPAPPDRFWTFDETAARSWAPIRVPGDWTMQGFAVKPGAAAAYLKTAALPAAWAGRRIILRCDGVQSEAEIWVNGRPAGSHAGGFTAFEIDVTPLVRPGAENTIALAVRNESLADDMASGTQYAAYQFGGITRKIALIAVPAVHVASLRIGTRLGPGAGKAVLRVEASLANAGRTAAPEAGLSFVLAGSDGRPVPLKAAAPAARAIGPGGKTDFVFESAVSGIGFWDAEHPRLYSLTAVLGADGRTVETVVRRFGFREVEAVGTQVYVNGSPIKVKGINRHETHPLLGRSLTPELSRRDAELFRNANINYIRTSHYPPTEEFLDACDELGLFVECEAPFVWIGHAANGRWASNDPHDPKLYPQIERAVGEMIAFHERHPSIIFWSLANESNWGPNWAKAKAFAAAMDPSRPQTFHDQAYGSYNNFGSTVMPVANFHYPGPQGPDLALDFPRPLLYGEYCHLNTYNRTEIAADPGVRDEYGRGLERQWERMYGSAAVIGGAIWSGINDIFYLPSGKAVGYGEWGPLDGWRREKPEYWHIKKTYSPIRVRPARLPVPPSGQPLTLQVENRHDFTNLNELRVVWSIGEERGEAALDLAPRRSGILRIPASAGGIDGKRLRLEFCSPRGFLIDAYEIPIGREVLPPPPGRPAGTAPLRLKEEGDRTIVEGRGFSWVFDKKSGSIIRAEAGGKTIFCGGPVPMILPQTSGPCVTDYSLDIKPFNDVVTGWTAESAEAALEKGSVVWTVRGRSKEVSGRYRIRIDPSGRADFEYELAVAEKINPRQWGLVLYLPREYDTLRWSRKAQWSVYPENHIGRPLGTARAVVPGRDFQFGVPPDWDWKDDQNELGSNDFRSTKSGLLWAALTSERESGLLLLSDGRHAARAFLDGGRVGWLIADFSTGGGDIFFAPHHKIDDRPLEKGETIRGAFTVQLLGPRP